MLKGMHTGYPSLVTINISRVMYIQIKQVTQLLPTTMIPLHDSINFKALAVFIQQQQQSL